MASKTRQQLLDELAAAIRSGGAGGKTTAHDVRAFLSSLIEEIIARSEESALPEDLLAALAGAGAVPSATNPFLTEQQLTAVTQYEVEIVRASGLREYFASHTDAWLAAQPGDMLRVHVPIADSLGFQSNQQIDVLPGVSVQTQGFPLGRPASGSLPATNGDVITLRGDKGKVLGGGSTLYVNSGGAWGVGNYAADPVQAATIDYEVEQLNIIAQSGNSCLTLQGAMKLRFAGNLLSNGKCVHALNGVQFLGTGSQVVTGTDSGMYCKTNVQATWRGSISLQGSTRLQVLTASTLHLDSCVVDGLTNRTAASYQLVNADATSTVILTNTTLLGAVGQTVLKAGTLILRGSSVIVGEILVTTLLDERPKAILVGDVPAAQVQVFTSSATWEKPDNATLVTVLCIGGGGGGGSGFRGGAGTVRTGGGGGGGGGVSERTFNAALIEATVAVTIPVNSAGSSGGSGGVSVATDTQAGANGGVGQTVSFGSHIRAGGGGAGAGGKLTAAGAGGGGGFGLLAGSAGGSSSATGTAGAVSGSAAGVGGGGAGGGLTAGNVAANGGAGGLSQSVVGTSPTAGVAPGGAGSSGQPEPVNATYTGAGAGGGASHATGPAGAGGNGGYYGGGGGGGGASANGFLSGAGGNGGPGVVVVITQ